MAVKPFKTIDELVALIKERGMQVDENTPLILMREGYYPIVNGYKDLLLDKDAVIAAGGNKDIYKNGSHFDELYLVFDFDRRLRRLLFKYLTIAEAVFKSVVVYTFCERYSDDNEAYLDENVYRKDEKYPVRARELIIAFETILGRSASKKRDFKRLYIEHYVNSYDDVPLWVLANYLTFGQVFMFYDFQKESMRNAIAKRIDSLREFKGLEGERLSEKSLRQAFDHIKDFRNICAHDERFYCAKVSRSKDVFFKDLLVDLKIVLSERQYTELRVEVTKLVLTMLDGAPSVLPSDVFEGMGYATIKETIDF